MNDYDSIESLSGDDFARLTPSHAELGDLQLFTRSTEDDLRSIERLLNLDEGALALRECYVEHDICPCGRLKTAYDFVFSAMVDAGHSREFLGKVLLGEKLIVNEARPIRCSASGHFNSINNKRYELAFVYGCVV